MFGFSSRSLAFSVVTVNIMVDMVPGLSAGSLIEEYENVTQDADISYQNGDNQRLFYSRFLCYSGSVHAAEGNMFRVCTRYIWRRYSKVTSGHCQKVWWEMPLLRKNIESLYWEPQHISPRRERRKLTCACANALISQVWIRVHIVCTQLLISYKIKRVCVFIVFSQVWNIGIYCTYSNNEGVRGP